MSGLPSDEAVLRSVVRARAATRTRVRTTTIGFEAVKALLARRVAGGDRVLERRGRRAASSSGPGMREFRVDDYGAPAYPELVLPVTRETLEEKPAVVRATIRALQRGYRRGPERPGERAVGDARRASAASTARRCARSSTRSPPSSRPARASSASCGPPCCASGRRGTRSSGSSKAPIDVAARSTRPSSGPSSSLAPASITPRISRTRRRAGARPRPRPTARGAREHDVVAGLDRHLEILEVGRAVADGEHDASLRHVAGALRHERRSGACVRLEP